MKQDVTGLTKIILIVSWGKNQGGNLRTNQLILKFFFAVSFLLRRRLRKVRLSFDIWWSWSPGSCPLSLAAGRKVSPGEIRKILSLGTFQEVFWDEIFCPRKVLHLVLTEGMGRDLFLSFAYGNGKELNRNHDLLVAAEVTCMMKCLCLVGFVCLFLFPKCEDASWGKWLQC